MSKRMRRKPANSKRPKSKLGLPDLDRSKTAILDSLRSPESKRGSRHALDEFYSAVLFRATTFLQQSSDNALSHS